MDLSKQISDSLDSRLALESVKGKRVVVSVKTKLTTASRGKLLLDTEKELRAQIDPKLEVFLEPQGDLNKLRLRLRGVDYEQ